jgi:hypothetical protein
VFHGPALLIGILLCSHLNGTEHLISQQERIVSPDDSPDADGIQPNNRDSLKFLLLKETMDVRRKVKKRFLLESAPVISTAQSAAFKRVE